MLLKKRKRPELFDRDKFREDFANLFGTFRKWLEDGWKKLPEIEEKIKDLPGTNYKLGIEHYRDGRFSDALLRFKTAIWFSPRHYWAIFRAGRCFQILGNKEKAVEYYQRALKIKPDFIEATFMLAVIGDKKVGSLKVPLTLVTEQFERLAPFFRPVVVERFGYMSQIAVEKGVSDWVSKKMSSDNSPVLARYDLIDLGCGTGLTGERLRAYAKSSIGVDISRPMLEQIPATAEGARPVYDEVVIEEISRYLARQPHAMADIITAASVFGYIGDLNDIIPPAAKVLRQGGVLAFTVDKLAGKDDGKTPYIWNMETGNFGFSVKYIRDLAASAGLKEIRMDEIMIYRNVPGHLFLYEKP